MTESVPSVTTHPASKTAADGSTVKFTVAASGGNLSYQWQYQKKDSTTWVDSGATGNKSSTLTVTAKYADSGIKYRCKVTNSKGTKASNAATLTVNDTRTYRALVVGNNDYLVGNPLHGCINDMNKMARMLQGLSNSFSVTTLPNAYKSSILGSIPSAYSGATSNDVSLFYYAGHGIEESGTNYHGALMGIDGEIITFSELASALSSIPGKIIVILDSCFSGASISDRSYSNEQIEHYLNDAVSAFSGYTVTTTVTDETGRSSELATSKFTVMAGAIYKETSQEIPYQVSSNEWASCGIFTACLVQGLGCNWIDGSYSGGNLPADTNGDMLFTLAECFEYAYQTAVDVSANLQSQYPDDYHEQHAACWGTKSDVLFRRK